MPTMMFAQRLIESFNVRDRNAITKGIKDMIANTSNSSGVIRIHPTSPALVYPIASIELNINPTIPLNSPTIHNTAIFVFQSSKTISSFELKRKNCICLFIAKSFMIKCKFKRVYT